MGVEQIFDLTQTLDLSQTFAILVLAGAVVWAMRLLRLELRALAHASQAVGQSQHAILEGMEALRQRVRDLEEQQALMRRAGKRPPAYKKWLLWAVTVCPLFGHGLIPSAAASRAMASMRSTMALWPISALFQVE